MRFFVGQIEYDDIYYDTRTRLETVCRQENEITWGQRYKNCFIVVTKITYSQMAVACAVTDYKIEKAKITEYVEQCVVEISDKGNCSRIKENISDLRLKEVTLPSFMTAMDDNALAKLFTDRDLFLQKIKLNSDKKCFREVLLDDSYWDKNTTVLDAGILSGAEKKRIRSGKKITDPMVQPLHYAIFEEDKETAKVMVKELLHYLCMKGRISSRRVVRIENSDLLRITLDNGVQNLNTLDGGCVVIEAGNKDGENSAEALLKMIGNNSHLYSETFTVIIVYSKKDKSTWRMLKEIYPSLAFLEIINPPMNRNEAIKYFENLKTEDGIEENNIDWESVLGDKEVYTNAEVGVRYRNWKRNVYSLKKYFPQYENVVAEYFREELEGGNARENLEKMIGLNEVKQTIDNIVDFFKLQKIRSSINCNISKPTMHMVFYGNPGTAKTTVARLLARILKEEKILEIGKLYEVGRADLVGKYVGWTAKTVKEYFEKARGSVLFIDEAYSLVEDNKSFGEEAINTIVQEMENHRQDVVVIMAGYRKDMERFVQSNKGLESRVAFYVEFPDYTQDELFLILDKMAQEEGFILDEDVRNEIVCKTYKKNYGNGRMMRNILDAAKIKQAGRILKMDEENRAKEMFLLKAMDFR